MRHSREKMESVAVRLKIYAFSLFIAVIICEVTSFPGENQDKSAVHDFIIVGGGTAGCVLANRLSKNGRHTILLLEAGGSPPEIMNIPGLAGENVQNPDLTFQYASVPQKHAALGTNGGVVKTVVGRVLGGSSQLNYLMFNRGSPHDYDHWANFTGDPSWKYDNMLRYFKRSEAYLGEYPSNEQHGFNGSIPVSYQAYAPGRNEWLQAGKELGFQVRDANGPQEVSFTPIEYTTAFGRRVSSYSGYLKPVMESRRNLKVVTNAYVTRLLIEGSTAVGVRYNTDGSSSLTSHATTFAYAKRDIILCAGTYGSAALLMRSGIGPKAVLHKAGVPLIKDLPVGKNFHDHPIVPMHFIIKNKPGLVLDPPTDYSPENLHLFEKFGKGPYTSALGYGGQAFLSSSVAAREGYPDWPDIHLIMSSLTTRLSTYSNFSVAPWETSIQLILYLGRVKSRGTVTLDPKNVDALPIVDFNYLEDEIDELVLLDAIDATLKIIEGTQTYRELEAHFPLDPVPACSQLHYRTKPYWKCVIRETLINGNHPVGTCSMNSVVDYSLRVRGMRRLRVVDASIMPYITNTNLQAAVYGIAEKTADEILQELL